jgi:signal transduction histidine kinase/ligand-binding sensor domain-containing protein/DNA-binding response OmpR family regulator
MFCVTLFAVGFTTMRAMDLPKGSALGLTDSWSMDKGLPQASVTAVIQTRDDYLWIGTDGGLARFDGMKFTTFRSANTVALANHAITRLFEDRSGTLWIGTESGLLRQRSGQFELAGLAGEAISALCEDASGRIWAGTGHGVEWYEHGAFQPVPGDPTRTEGVQAMFADSSGRIWISVAQRPGLVCYHDGQFEIARPGEALRGEVLAMAEQPRGTLWFGTTSGLVRLKAGTYVRFGTEHGLSGGRVTALNVDSGDGLWIASSGLQRINDDELKSIAAITPMSSRIVQSLCRDREGNIWLGTTGDGLMRVRAAPFLLIALNARSVSNGFRTVMQDPSGVIWLAQGTLGYTRIASENDVTRSLPATDTEEGEVLAVYKSRRGDLWIGGRDALRLVRDGNSESHPELAGVRAIFEDRGGTIWMGRQKGGITRWHDGVFTPLNLPASFMDATPQSFAETAGGDIWIGTWTHGLIRMHGDEMTLFNRDTGLPCNELRCVYVDREDRVWVGTKGRGLAVLDGGRWIVPEWTSEIIDQQVISLIEDEADHLWLATPRGVFMAPRRDLLQAMRGTLPLNRLQLVNATEGWRQELADLSCFPAVWRTQQGHLWFATRRGMMRLDATRTRPNLVPPTVHIERLLVNGQRQPAADQIVLPPDSPGLTIEYTGLSFTSPGRVRFQYRLEGIDTAWIDAEDRRTAYYAKLPPGHYRFHVIASNADGVWNDHGATLAIVQQAHLYEQPWVPWGVGLSLVGMIAAGYRWRTVVHNRERRRLEAGIAARTRELLIAKDQAEASTQAKAEFLETISHEIRNPLNGIIGLVAMLREAPLDARERELAQSLGACAKALARVFDEVLSFSRLEHGHVTVRERSFAVGPMMEEVAALFRIMARQRGSEIIVRREGDMPEHWIGDVEKIESILGNFVSNAVKYAPGSPVEILVQCDALDEFGADVTFNVTDHGPGIPPEEQERIFEKFVRGTAARVRRAPGTGLGLATSRALADVIGGHVAVESEPGRGATFFLRVRLKRDRRPAPDGLRLPAMTAPAKGRALIVEDQPYNQIVVCRIAERLGFATDVAHDAEDALVRLGRQAYAVVFVDWELPGMKGDELVRKLREQAVSREAIVIATTAHDSDEIRSQCAAAGMDGFALKPFETETVARLIEQARRRRSGRQLNGVPKLDTRVFRFVGYDDPEQAGQAARLYLDILEQEVGLLEGALRQRDSAGTAAAAHRIKSHAGLVDAAELRETADRLQREARTAPDVALDGLREDLLRHAAALREQLKAWRSEDEGG